MESLESQVKSEPSEANIFNPNIEEFANFANYVTKLENKKIYFALVSKMVKLYHREFKVLFFYSSGFVFSLSDCPTRGPARIKN